MQLPVFSYAEAASVAWETPLPTLKLQLSQWTKTGHLIRLRRGVYAFPRHGVDTAMVAQRLYSPAYISLESALQYHGLLPDAVFAVTLVTPRTTRQFQTPWGHFIYHHLKQELYWGFDPGTLLAEPEKAVVDYCYLYSGRLQPSTDCWDAMRWQHLAALDFQKLQTYGKKTGVRKVMTLIASLVDYGTTQTHRAGRTAHR